MNHLEFIGQNKDFSAHSKLWLYQANRILNKAELDEITAKLESFAQNWAAHGKPLRARTAILYDSLLVFMVDGNSENASGCSIDSSVRFVKNIGEEYAIDFMDRSIVLVLKGNNFAVKKIDNVASKDIIVNYSLASFGEFQSKLLQEFASSAYAKLAHSSTFTFKL